MCLRLHGEWPLDGNYPIWAVDALKSAGISLKEDGNTKMKQQPKTGVEPVSIISSSSC